MRLRWLTLIAFVLAPSLASAQPVVRDHRDKGPARRPHVAGPREAPPPPRAESPGEKAGFVWIGGRWEWRRGKYEWIAGHWERARANKAWRPGRWEQRGDEWAYVEGTWGDAPATPPGPPPGPPGPPVVDDRPRQPPPPPQAEKYDARPGFVWVAGEWDWRAGKWAWVPGHWERERAGKQWRPARWELRDGYYTRTAGDWIDGTPPPPPVADGRPRQPPPPPQAERYDARPGFVWAAGEWDWRDGKWTWVPGHWERERAGRQWRPARWELRDGAYVRVTGEWVPAGATMPPPDPGERPRRPRRDWKFDRPVVSSYWPVKGKPGTRIRIRGKNFPRDATVLWAGKELRGVKVTPDEIVFLVPADATTGQLAVRAGARRPLAVGGFEVAAAFDAEAERRRLEEEARQRAQAEWAARQQKLAKDRAAREAAVRERFARRAATREQRRQERLAAIRAKFARAFLADEETQAELNLHAQRIAELERMAEIAEIRNDAKLAVRVEVLRSHEDRRHDQRMAALEAAFRAGGGQ